MHWSSKKVLANAKKGHRLMVVDVIPKRDVLLGQIHKCDCNGVESGGSYPRAAQYDFEPSVHDHLPFAHW